MAGQDDQARPISLFYSYSHKDEDLRLKLETHLAVLRRAGMIAEWHDRKIEAGTAWKGQIDRQLTSADIVLLLVSPDFFASDYCWGDEMAKASVRHERGEARVIPVILRHCRWQSTPLANLQAVPRGAKPIKSWPDKDKAFDDVVAEIERAVQTLRKRVAQREARRAEAKPKENGRQHRPAARETVATEQETVPSQRGGPSLEPPKIFRDIDEPWCPELVVIPAGSFVMGSLEDEAEDAEGPQHRVTFASPFAFGRYPVTFEEYDQFCANTKREKPPDRGFGRGRRSTCRGRMPRHMSSG